MKEKLIKFYKRNEKIIRTIVRSLSLLIFLNITFGLFYKRLVPTADIVAISFILLAIVVGKGKRFIIDWLPIFILFYVYETIRGHAHFVHEFFNINVHKTLLLEWEQAIFGQNIPTLIFQRFIKPEPTMLDYFAFFVYTSFFWAAFLTGFILWIKSRNFFIKFRNAYIILCYSGVITYLFFPAYPPWLASKEGFLPPLQTETYDRLWVNSVTLGVFKNAGYNPVAPMPSLHTGWSVLCAIMLDYYFKKKLGIFSKLFYLYPLGMFFVIIYTSDHYVVDIIGGIIYAVAAAILGINLSKIINYLKNRFRYNKEIVAPELEYNLNVVEERSVK